MTGSDLQRGEAEVPAEDAFAAIAARFEALLDGAPLGVAFLDRALRVEHINAALAAVLGAAPEECRGRTVSDVIPELAAAVIPAFTEVLESGRTISELELSGVAPGTQGKTRYWRASFFPVRARSSAVTGVGVILRDVTTRKEAADRERTRARHRESLHALAADLVAALTTRDIVAAVVAHAASAFGAAGSVIARLSDDGTQVELLDAAGMPPGLASEWRRFPLTAPVPLAQVARTGEPLFLESKADWEREFPALAAVADSIGHSANAVIPLMVEGRPVGAIGVAFRSERRFDEEERALAISVGRQCSLALERARLLEAERVARAEADLANQAKTHFLATMSHELRTPLNAIGGYTQLIDMGIYGPVTQEQREAVVRIQRSKDHLLGLVGNLLSLTKVGGGHESFDIGDVPLEMVLEFVSDATAPQRRAKSLRYEVACPPGLAVRADVEKLRQILINLLSNAVKFTDPHGEIAVRAGREADRVRVTVRDTGCGIEEAELERVFAPFVQVGRQLNRPVEGIGLGLAISRELARAMGGELAVTSAPGEGSTFVLTLPAA